MGLEVQKMGLEVPKMGLEVLKMGVEAPKMGLEVLKIGVEATKMGLELINSGLEVINLGLKVPDLGFEALNLGLEALEILNLTADPSRKMPQRAGIYTGGRKRHSLITIMFVNDFQYPHAQHGCFAELLLWQMMSYSVC